MIFFREKMYGPRNYAAKMSLTGFAKPLIPHGVANKTNESLRRFRVKQKVRLQLTIIRCVTLHRSRDSDLLPF